jgi:hypothetical protein
MKNFVFWVFAIGLLAVACQDNPNPPPPSAGTAGTDSTKNFFPVADYLRSEIRYVDSTPLAIEVYHIQGSKTDSAFIQASAFNLLAKEFLPAELDSPSFEKNFSEVSFFDQTTNSLTFSYTAKSNTGGLRRVDVIATQRSGFDKVKSIYMEERINNKDSLVTKKMYWKPKKSFLVLTISQTGDLPKVNRQLKVVWDAGD